MGYSIPRREQSLLFIILFLVFRLATNVRRLYQIVHHGIDRQATGAFDLELLPDITAMRYNCMLREEKMLGNTLVGHTLDDTEEYLSLASGKVLRLARRHTLGLNEAVQQLAKLLHRVGYRDNTIVIFEEIVVGRTVAKGNGLSLRPLWEERMRLQATKQRIEDINIGTRHREALGYIFFAVLDKRMDAHLVTGELFELCLKPQTNDWAGFGYSYPYGVCHHEAFVFEKGCKGLLSLQKLNIGNKYIVLNQIMSRQLVLTREYIVEDVIEFITARCWEVTDKEVLQVCDF